MVQLLVGSLAESVDRCQFLGYLEALDFIFQVYEPAIYYASNPNSQQLLDLLTTCIALLKHPYVSFDVYTHDILLRLCGTLHCAHSWLSMKKLDKLVQEVHFNISNNGHNGVVQQLLETLANAIRMPTNSSFSSQAELETGLTYIYSFAFGNVTVRSAIDQLFVHTVKLLCVLACVIDESALPSNLTANLNMGSAGVTAAPPPPTPSLLNIQTVTNTSAATRTSTTSTTTTTSTSTSTSSLQAQQASSPPPTQSAATASSPSFLKSKFSSFTDNKLLSSKPSSSFPNTAPITPATVVSNATTAANTTEASSPKPKTDSSFTLPKTSIGIYLGYFQNSSHYLKLYESLKILYGLYKKSAGLAAYDKFCQMVKSTLKLLTQLLESALSVQEVGPHLDEILLYLRVLFGLEPSCAVKCVTLCLKSLFGLNLAGLMAEYIQQQILKSQAAAAAAATAASQANEQAKKYQPSHSRSQSNSQNLVNQNQNQQQQQQQQSSLSGFSSVLSTSLSSIASLTTTTSQTGAVFGNLAAANCWSTSSSSKRGKTSLFVSCVESKCVQFNKFMYSQSVMFRNDNILGGTIQFNPAGHLLNIGFDSIEYVTTATTNTTSITAKSSNMVSPAASPASITSSRNSISGAATSMNTASFAASVSNMSSGIGGGSNKSSGATAFNIFGFMKKNKDKSPTNVASTTSVSNVTSAAANSSSGTAALNQASNQQQQLIELQQQRIKQQKNDLKTISQYIKSFESIVIKSLRQYTLTTSANLQTKILELLVQLIFLKVDYCLLDSDKVFIGK